MLRNACHFYLPRLANRQMPFFTDGTRRSRRRGATMRNPLSALAEFEMSTDTAKLAVAETVANAISNTPPNTTVLLGFDNLVHFLDWLDAEQALQSIAEAYASEEC